MNKKALAFTLASLLTASMSTAVACEYIRGESKFVDYATCRYGEDSVLVVDLPEGSAWDSCVYHVQAFRPEKLLAITKDNNGKEEISINDRSAIGNPCYLTKQRCDAAMKEQNKGAY
jgi:hypothetical protein